MISLSAFSFVNGYDRQRFNQQDNVFVFGSFSPVYLLLQLIYLLLFS